MSDANKPFKSFDLPFTLHPEFKHVYNRVANTYLENMFAFNEAPVRVEPPAILTSLQLKLLMIYFTSWRPRVNWSLLLDMVQEFEDERGHSWTMDELKCNYYYLCSGFTIALETHPSEDRAKKVLLEQIAEQ